MAQRQLQKRRFSWWATRLVSTLVFQNFLCIYHYIFALSWNWCYKIKKMAEHSTPKWSCPPSHCDFSKSELLNTLWEVGASPSHQGLRSRLQCNGLNVDEAVCFATFIFVAKGSSVRRKGLDTSAVRMLQHPCPWPGALELIHDPTGQCFQSQRSLMVNGWID